MKRYTIKYGAFRTRADAEKAWIACWRELSMRQIQKWIERIPRYIQEVIRLDGGNEYKEGRSCNVDQIPTYKQQERKDKYESRIAPEQKRNKKKDSVWEDVD